ncbi:MAG: hypothetical protein ACREQQ_09550, partial [Candidatus Binatia bacterium]
MPKPYLLMLLLGATPAIAGDRDAGAARKVTVDFEGFPSGRVPQGFVADVTGSGAASAWSVVEDDTAPGGKKVLAQTSSDPTDRRFPLCVYEGLRARDFVVSVRLRPISGEVDRAGGIVWRYRDRENYYVVRANALEGNVVLYKVDKGKRTDLKPLGAGWSAYGQKVEVPSGRWSELHVEARGTRHSVSLAGKHLFDVEDDTFR